jgi:hypothetical protein
LLDCRGESGVDGGGVLFISSPLLLSLFSCGLLFRCTAGGEENYWRQKRKAKAMARACWLVLLCFLLLIFFLLLVPIVSFLDRLFSGFLPRASCLGFTEKKMVAVGFGGGWFGAPLTEKAVSGAGKKWPREGNGQGRDWFWVFSLSRLQN